MENPSDSAEMLLEKKDPTDQSYMEPEVDEVYEDDHTRRLESTIEQLESLGPNIENANRLATVATILSTRDFGVEYEHSDVVVQRYAKNPAPLIEQAQESLREYRAQKTEELKAAMASE